MTQIESSENEYQSIDHQLKKQINDGDEHVDHQLKKHISDGDEHVDHQLKKQIIDGDEHVDHQLKKQINDGDEHVLKLMDSLDAYLRLIDSLSSTLRQGWFDFASARYSMGASRVNSALLDLKEHPAATSLEVREGGEPHFTLCNWTTFDAGDTEELKDNDNGLQQEEVKEESSPDGGPSATTEYRVQKGRSKSLAVFGTLVSPKLRAAQLSFETALETAVEIANARASMLSTLDQVQQLMAEPRD